MALPLFLHPVVGLAAIGLLLGAYAARARRRRSVHYVLGISALTLAAISFASGLATVVTASADGIDFEETVTFHLVVALILVVLLGRQAWMGLSMVLGGHRRQLHPHRASGRLLVVLAGVVLLLGAITYVAIGLD